MFKNVLVNLALILLLAAFVRPGQAEVNSVDSRIKTALDDHGMVRVIVMFAPKPDPSISRSASDSAQVQRFMNEREQILSDMGGDLNVKRSFLMIPGFAAEIDQHQLNRLMNHPQIESIELDLPGSGHMVEGSPLANIPPVYCDGLDGKGIKVAVIDSGIDTDHIDFSDRLVDEQCMCSQGFGTPGCCPNGEETQSGAGSAEDDNGHGTNVAGIVASNGSISQRGGAPAAEIVAVKVLDRNNGFCCLSDIIAGFDWVRVNHPDTKVINASLGTFSLFNDSCDTTSSAMTEAINNLVANDTMIFVSSGNQGSDSQMSIPACNSQSFAVGASWDAPRGTTSHLGCADTDITARKPTCFTNSNSTLDLFAPGAFIESAGRDGGLSSYGGTSQASPMTAGCAAALRAEYPAATVAQINAVLKASPTSVIDAKNSLEFPFLDCNDARDRLEALYPSSFTHGFELPKC